jgi:phenylalanyl-tRNA synthetase beta chain
MKVSLAWMFEHINGDWTNVNVPLLVDLFNKTTAEIAGVSKLELDLGFFSLAMVTKIGHSDITVFSQELGKTIEMPSRSDVFDGEFYLIKKDGAQFRWVTMRDLGSEKELLLPALYCPKELVSGGWKKYIKTSDYIFDIDNKSITNRPDMWGHRGVAREVAALLKLDLKVLQNFLIEKVVKRYEGLEAPAELDNPFTIKIEDSLITKQYAGIYCNQIEPRASTIAMVFDLVRVDCRPISAIVDGTNYVMLDLGQPMHAFDAEKVASHTIVPRKAKEKESLVLLDGQIVELTPDDYVITDGKKPLALAGVMGGQASAVDRDTTAVFIESAVFDGGTIRKTAARIHVRTDSSARFEKSLDPNQSSVAILRLLKVWHDAGVQMQAAGQISLIGQMATPHEIVVTHDCIEKHLGVSLPCEFVTDILRRLEFLVREDAFAEQTTYSITVPTFRGTKDVTIKEDIIEEVGRYFGYSTIPAVLPNRAMQAHDLAPIMRVRTIKNCMAYVLSMHEVCNYAMFDESFLHELQWEPEHTVDIKNPVSENWRRMATTLMPGLIKNVVTNKTEADILQFFEYGRTWQLNQTLKESNVLAGILYNQKSSLDFYAAKAQVTRLFDILDLAVIWQKVEKPAYPWLAPYQTADIMYGDKKIGYAGKAHCSLLKNFVNGDAFMFELDADFLVNYRSQSKRFVSMPKYPGVQRDVSVMVPATVTVDSLLQAFKNVSDVIVDVALVDFFIKEDWFDKRSLTFRVWLQDEEKTMTTEQVDAVWTCVTQILTSMGAEIR